ncbi:autotransporter outer membrane beta-barrel domain-containing protein [Hydrogenophaga sp. 2FB]|uniref:autotransporter family protein n=1 Tax=Hydrogenophaga sp. 2FB TaxID=2502187 RepID=UPI0010F59908|nr:autotransporter outer membrane beta-barrel domain-containing protein [Hydrogenophaga sp. 2FB]
MSLPAQYPLHSAKHRPARTGDRLRSAPSRGHQRILQAAVLGALGSLGASASAADIGWTGTAFATNQWSNTTRWSGGVVPGAGDRAVFSLNVVGAANNYVFLLSGAPISLGAVQVNASSSLLRLGNNESQAQVQLYGIGGVGARNEGVNMVRFFKYTKLMGSLSFEASNAAGGGFEFSTGITPIGMPHVGIDLNGYHLTLNPVNAANAITFSAGVGITGTGDVIKTGAGLVSFAGNATVNNYTGATFIRDGRLALLGTGAIANSRLVDIAAPGVFDISGTTTGAAIRNLSGSGSVLLGARTLDITAASGRFDGVISGAGGLRVASTDRFVLGGLNTYYGATQVNAGTLAAGATQAFSATSAHTVAAGAALDLAGFNQQLAALTNNGTVSTVGSMAGTTLTVAGPYTSGNGTLRLGAGANAGDRLVLDGAAATPTGQTRIEVVPLPGLGGLTTGDGILLVNAINGATSTAQTTRDAFSLVGGQVNSGAYEYRLYAGDAAGAGENWYLRTDANAYRQEVALVAAAPQQLRQADQAMLGNLHLRMGSRVLSPDARRQGWARFISTDRITAQAGTVSPDSQGRLNGLQVGTPVWGDANSTAGVYVGQLAGSSRVSGLAAGAHGTVGKTDLFSMYLGAYATHRRDSGFYVDSALQAGVHRARLRPGASAASHLKGLSLLGSVELGQSLPLGAGWVLEPQAQLMVQTLDVSNTTLPGATTVGHSSDTGWTLRLGARVQGEFATGLGRLQPYGRVNLFTTASGTDRAGFGTGTVASHTGIDTRAGGRSAELAVGATLAVSERSSVYGELGQLWASGGNAHTKSGLSGSVGVQLQW